MPTVPLFFSLRFPAAYSSLFSRSRSLSVSLSPPPQATMPRRSSGRSAPRAAPRPAPVRNPPQPAVSQAPPPAPVRSGGSSVFGGIGSTIAQGMAFGTGSAVAHRAVDAVLGPRTMQHEVVGAESPAAAAAPMSHAVSADACSIHSKAFQDCINSNGSDISKCQFYLDMLTECRRGSGSMLSA